MPYTTTHQPRHILASAPPRCRAFGRILIHVQATTHLTRLVASREIAHHCPPAVDRGWNSGRSGVLTGFSCGLASCADPTCEGSLPCHCFGLVGCRSTSTTPSQKSQIWDSICAPYFLATTSIMAHSSGCDYGANLARHVFIGNMVNLQCML
jgi:hypothetical protein